MNRKEALLSLSVLAACLSLHSGNVDAFRICGGRLADMLHLVCEQHGGFHAPKLRRTAPGFVDYAVLLRALRPIPKRTDVSSSAETLNEEVPGGVVDECCRKQCSLTTLTSYCVYNMPDESFNLEKMLPRARGNSSPKHDAKEVKPLSGYGLQKAPIPVTSAPAIVRPLHTVSSYRRRPNIGMFSRTRPVFIVLSQINDDDPLSLGEYRF